MGEMIREAGQTPCKTANLAKTFVLCAGNLRADAQKLWLSPLKTADNGCEKSGMCYIKPRNRLVTVSV